MTAVIIVAMESERVHLDALMPGWEATAERVWTTRTHSDVICITCGVGMIAAAAATEHAIREYAPDLILNFGCTGAHVPDIWPGDVVIGESLIHQGRMRIDESGAIHPLPFGFTVPGDIATTEHPRTDDTLVSLAQQVANGLDLPRWPEELRVQDQPQRAPEVRTGTISSGDVWLQNTALINARHEASGSLCEDMEAAAIGQICAMHGVPFLAVKDISNSEFHVVTEFEGSSSGLPEAEVGKRSAMVIAGMLERLGDVGSTRRARM